MTKLIKIEYRDIPNETKKNFKNEKHFECYQVINDGINIWYFIAYDNDFHLNNKYIYPETHTFKSIDNKEAFDSISAYFNKPLQVMIDSNEKEIIEVLNRVGFVLKRQSFEREFKFEDIKKLDENTSTELNSFSKGDKRFDEACLIALDQYINNHKEVSPLTATLEEFKTILPDQVVCQIVDDRITNLSFIEENELCYLSSVDMKSFESFSNSIIKHMFKSNDSIFIEVDSTDYVALKFKSFFNDNSNDSFDTYIFNRSTLTE
ncbi:MAG: hypothetical protein RBQ97_02045 [Acholeplasma sp.]|nr:hypothetical protein [Acholeplasma sp.]